MTITIFKKAGLQVTWDGFAEGWFKVVNAKTGYVLKSFSHFESSNPRQSAIDWCIRHINACENCDRAVEVSLMSQ